LQLVYSITFAALKNTSVTTEDNNARRSIGDCDEVARITYSRYEPWGAIDSFRAGEPTLGVVDLEKGKGSSVRGV